MSDANEPKLSDPESREIGDLANALLLAQPDATAAGAGPGGAVFLIGAGCSVSAGIKSADGVARFCAVKLARKLSNGKSGDDPDVALAWLIKERRVELNATMSPRSDGSHWGPLYPYFFEHHFQSANMQRDIINEIVEAGGDRLNWAHACLGELVHLRYVHTVLTTNFDQLVLQGVIRTGDMPVTADGLEALTRITSRPKRPQVVHLHGSMHTYDLRNSPSALKETSSSSTAQTMIHTLMADCDLLVVVGYGGGEDGIMALLKDAGSVRTHLVIYWVTYQPGLEDLTANARQLLSGEHKFTVWGGDADKFFGDLMAEMGLGQPRWVHDPISVLKEQSDRLHAPASAREEIKILVDALKSRVGHAADNRWDEQSELIVEAAAKRARGDYRAAYDILGSIDDPTDLRAARLHALNGLSLFEQDQDENGELLTLAIEEFERIVEGTNGDERLENVLSLCLALVNQSEAQEDGAGESARQPLRRVADVARKWLATYTAERTPLGNARLNLQLAQAMQSLSETPFDRDGLQESLLAYEAAIAGLTEKDDPDGRLINARSGMAAVYQVQGEADGDSGLLRQAVEIHREIVEATRRADQTIEEAGPIENLAGSLMALAKVLPAGEATAVLGECRSTLDRLLMTRQVLGDTAGVTAVRVLLDEVDSLTEENASH